MKTLIQTLLVALIFGGLSAGGTFYFHKFVDQKIAVALEARAIVDKEAAAAVAAEGEAKDLLADDSSMKSDAPVDESIADEASLNAELAQLMAPSEAAIPPAAVRPPWDADGDEAGALINQLRTRARATSQQDRKLLERETMLDLIFNDMRIEQAKSAKMRKRFLEEAKQSLRAIDSIKQSTVAERASMQSANERIESLRREREEASKAYEEALTSIRDEQAALRKQLDELKNPPEPIDDSGSPEETVNLKNLVAAVDSMAPEETAKIIKKFVKRGRTAGAVAILDAMIPRKRGAVITALTESDPELAAELAERLKRLKKNAKPAANVAK